MRLRRSGTAVGLLLQATVGSDHPQGFGRHLSGTLPPSVPAGCLCSNSCIGAPQYADDGICDDGGSGSQYGDCELGTDCNDCAKNEPPDDVRCGYFPPPWLPSSPTPPPPPSPPGPAAPPAMPPPTQPPPVVPPPAQPPGCVCTDTCAGAAISLASDGICDDGGTGSIYADCHLGTDCTDCGSARCSVPPPSPLEPPPGPPGRPPTVPPPPAAPPTPLVPGCICMNSCSGAAQYASDGVRLLSTDCIYMYISYMHVLCKHAKLHRLARMQRKLYRLARMRKPRLGFPALFTAF